MQALPDPDCDPLTWTQQGIQRPNALQPAIRAEDQCTSDPSVLQEVSMLEPQEPEALERDLQLISFQHVRLQFNA